MRTANFTELRRNLRGYLDAVVNDSETVIVSRDSGSAVVMISLDEYNAIKETEYLMQSPATMSAIRKGINEANHGCTLRQTEGESISDFLTRI